MNHFCSTPPLDKPPALEERLRSLLLSPTKRAIRDLHNTCLCLDSMLDGMDVLKNVVLNSMVEVTHKEHLRLLDIVRRVDSLQCVYEKSSSQFWQSILDNLQEVQEASEVTKNQIGNILTAYIKESEAIENNAIQNYVLA